MKQEGMFYYVQLSDAYLLDTSTLVSHAKEPRDEVWAWFRPFQERGEFAYLVRRHQYSSVWTGVFRDLDLATEFHLRYG